MELTKKEKVSIVSNSEEIKLAVKMLIVLMEDAEIENYITVSYQVGDYDYLLSFTKNSLIK